MNWKKQTMSFWNNKKWVTLQGIEGYKASMVALQSILSKPRISEQRVFWEMEKHEHKTANSDLNQNQQMELNIVLQQYAAVFKEPS
ncbi:hypothetical protein A2U01_0064171, partial [Trifolium medium]|nr:hypothetical protein [Trifolium medium]